jgi:Zn-dependent protease
VFDQNFDILKSAAMIMAFLVAIIGHEIMHAYTAYRYGDPTAKNLGRLNPNPLLHIDPVGSILIPGALFLFNAPFLFGWAKPVPVNVGIVIRNGGYKAAVQVSLAGITYNFALGCIMAIAFSTIKLDGEAGRFLSYFFMYSVAYNIFLGYFNLLPIPTLDGANAIRFWSLKHRMYEFAAKIESMERYAMVFLILFIATPISKILLLPAFIVIDWLIG